MSKRNNFHVMATAAIIFVASSMPLYAGGLGGLGGTIGGALGGLGNAVGKTADAAGNTVSGVTGNIANTTTQLGAFNKKGILSLDGRSDLTNSLMAKARVLSPNELAKLCLAAGGGEKGCGSGNKPRILGFIDARLDVLSHKRLLGLCASLGGGCGGSSITIGGDGGGGEGLGGMSRAEVVAYKKRCVNVLSSPQGYEADIVSICRLIKRQKA